MMTEWEALQARISCRSYRDKRIDEETLGRLLVFVEELNQESGLHFQMCTSGELGKPAVKLASAMFSGNVYAFLALVGGEDSVSSEKVGYYGEKFVLYATQLGLGTCWVAGTYDRKSVHVELEPEEKLWGVIPLGYATEKVPMKQKMIRATIRRKDRRAEQFVESALEFERLPDWLQRAVEAVKMGPSAVNQQPVNIVYQDKRIYAKIWKDGHGLQFIDLGIAKRQFEVGAASCGVCGKWAPGDMGEFLVEKTETGD